ILAGLRDLLMNLPEDESAVFQDEVDINLNPKIGGLWLRRGQQAEVVTPGDNAQGAPRWVVALADGEAHGHLRPQAGRGPVRGAPAPVEAAAAALQDYPCALRQRQVPPRLLGGLGVLPPVRGAGGAALAAQVRAGVQPTRAGVVEAARG